MTTVGRFALAVLAASTLCARPAAAQDVPPDYQAVITTLGKTGDFKDGVLKVNVPRNDIRVTIGGRPAPTPFGFGGWVALTKGEGGRDVLMGDLVLTEDEVDPVMAAATALSMTASAGLMRVARSAAVPTPWTCMKNIRGLSWKKWLCSAVTSRPLSSSADITGLT